MYLTDGQNELLRTCFVSLVSAQLAPFIIILDNINFKF